MDRHQIGITTVGLLLVTALLATLRPVDAAQDGKVGPKAADVQASLDKAIGYLKSSQAKDGSFSRKIAGPGITAITVAALLRNGVDSSEPVVASGLKFLESQTRKDGGIYDEGLANYTTAVALMTLKEANKNGKYDSAIKNAADFVKGIQHVEDGLDQGGWGYAKGSRADLGSVARCRSDEG
jgi:Squalene-hopene cyclase C-terminal domain